MKKIAAEAIQNNAFELIGKDWMLVTAKKQDGSTNTMTASWGGVGIMWGKPVAYVVIRPQRYTKEFMDEAGCFSLSFMGDAYREQLGYCGKVSGRDEDKIAKIGLPVAEGEIAPYFDCAKVAMECKTLFAQPIDPACLLDGAIDDRWYPGKDYHTLYIAEIVAAYEAE